MMGFRFITHMVTYEVEFVCMYVLKYLIFIRLIFVLGSVYSNIFAYALGSIFVRKMINVIFKILMARRMRTTIASQVSATCLA